jgi:hypothetical protein
MQRYTIFFINVNAVHVSGGFSTHHQELKNYTASGICQACLLQPLAWVSRIYYNPTKCALHYIFIQADVRERVM